MTVNFDIFIARRKQITEGFSRCLQFLVPREELFGNSGHLGNMLLMGQIVMILYWRGINPIVDKSQTKILDNRWSMNS